MPDVPSAPTHDEEAAALRWALERARVRSPDGAIIVIADDLQDLDGPSRQTLGALLTDPPPVGGLVVAACKDDFDPRWVDAMNVDVDALTIGKAKSTLSSVTPLSSWSRATVLPLYLEHLIRFIREGGEGAPTGIGDLLAARIERLESDALRVLQAVAVLGSATQDRVLEVILPGLDDTDDHLAALENAGLLTVDGCFYDCSHELVSAIVLSSIPREARRDLHARAREAFDTAGVTMPPEAAALHSYEAGASFDALIPLEQSAARAQAYGDMEGAERAFRLALDLAHHESNGDALMEASTAVPMFSCKLGDVLTARGRHRQAERILSSALPLAAPISKERSRILGSLAIVTRRLGRLKVAENHRRDALRLAGRSEQAALADALRQLSDRWTKSS